ncbi:MAG: MarR family transcriptional regulator [Cytophagales bacterium]|nr:MarR family transcriptional regulator [Cytophagales bacterium]
MKLEAEIKQERFESEHQKAAINVLLTANWLYNQNSLFLKQFLLTPEQFNVLRILRGSHPATLKLLDIRDRMIDKNSNCTRLVEKLRQKGFVKREVCAANRRQVDISITPKGLSLLAKIDGRTADNPWRQLTSRLTKSESSELNSILDKIRS